MRCPFSGGWSGTSDRGRLVVRVCSRVAPRRGDAVTPVAVAGHCDLGGPGEPRAVDAAPRALPVPPLDLYPGQTRVLLAQPAHHSPPQVVAEVGEAALTRAVTVVVGPAAKDWVEHMDERFEREVRRRASGQFLDPVHDLAQRSFAWEAVGDRRMTGPRAAHDAKPEQVEAVVDVGEDRKA